jgi:hypothetical protein
MDPEGRGQRRGRGFRPLGLVRRLVVLAFAVIQAILVARILIDLGIIPTDGPIAEAVVPWSEALIAPVEGIAGNFGGLGGLGGIGALGMSAGSGIDPIVLGALAGWTVVEGLVLGVVRRFAAA